MRNLITISNDSITKLNCHKNDCHLNNCKNSFLLSCYVTEYLLWTLKLDVKRISFLNFSFKLPVTIVLTFTGDANYVAFKLILRLSFSTFNKKYACYLKFDISNKTTSMMKNLTGILKNAKRCGVSLQAKKSWAHSILLSLLCLIFSHSFQSDYVTLAHCKG